MARTKALIDDRSYQVAITHDGATVAVWRSPWLVERAARDLAQQKRGECERAGWRVKVQIFYRDGSEVR